MSATWEEANAFLFGESGPFAMHEEVIRGIPTKVLNTAPAVLRNLFDLARTRGDQPYLVYEDETYTFAQVMEQIDAVGAMLVDRYGLSKGDRVAIAMRNYPEWITSFAAITSIGCIAVPLNAWWTAEELLFGLEDSGSKVAIVDEERLERLTPLLDRSPAKLIAVRTSGELPGDVDRFEEVLPLGAPLPEVEVDTDDDATILYTSGTTGKPKGAVSTHRAIVSALLSFAARGAVESMRNAGKETKESTGTQYPPCMILTVPLFHVTGCVPVMLGSFISGSKLVIMYKWDPERALQLVERERVTQFVGVPTMSWDMLEHPNFSKYDTSSLQAVGGGGAPAPPELVKRIEGNFSRGRPTIGYGMTETNAYGPGNSGDDYVTHPTSTGRVVPLVDLRVTDPDGNTLPSGDVGEIWFRGPHLIRGYWNRPDETAETIVDGWLRSGDIGRIDEEGFVYVVDRAKDMVLRGGENIYCAEVEAAIYEHPDVHEAAVFGVPHERLGEELAAAVMPKPGRSIDIADLQAHVGQRLASFKVPTKVVISDEPLPRNAAGKILKRELRDTLAAALG